MLYCSVNYQEITNISSQDRGLSYGDGIFTTGKVLNGEFELLTQHINRLKSACIALSIVSPNFVELNNNIKNVAKNYTLAVLKVIITAGIGGRGYSRLSIEQPTIIISVFDFPRHYFDWKKQGISLGECHLQLGVNPMLSGIKHLNRLEQVLIRRELDACAEDDLLVTDLNGVVVETSCANVFWLKDDLWQTPNISYSGIAGLMRAEILAQVDSIQIVDAKLTDLVDVKAIFICNSVMGLVPVNEYNKKRLSISAVDAFIASFNFK